MTRAVHVAYARRRGYELQDFFGLAVPPFPLLTRVWRLNEAAASAVLPHDWFVYLDADALVYDDRCTFEELIANRSGASYAALFCADPMGYRGHHVNAGVFLANLNHPLAQPLACTWRRRLAWDAWRRDAAVIHLFHSLVLRRPPRRWVDDQRVLHGILEDFGPRYPSLYQAVPVDVCTFNGKGGTLVRHVFGGKLGPEGKLGKQAAMRQTLAEREHVARTPLRCTSRLAH